MQIQVNRNGALPWLLQTYTDWCSVNKMPENAFFSLVMTLGRYMRFNFIIQVDVRLMWPVNLCDQEYYSEQKQGKPRCKRDKLLNLFNVLAAGTCVRVLLGR